MSRSQALLLHRTKLWTVAGVAFMLRGGPTHVIHSYSLATALSCCKTLFTAVPCAVACRAGRDGLPSECVLMFAGADVSKLCYMARMSEWWVWMREGSVSVCRGVLTDFRLQQLM